jgi:23S rRNA C2498 (ribose-2'-O)-methylase RlmM
MENLDQQQREARVLEITQRKSNQEKELDYEVWRTNQCKNLITENRKLREKQYERRRQLDVQNGIIKEETLLGAL